MPSVPELPFADDVMRVAGTDLESSRALLQRLVSIQDALFATTVTIVGAFLGLGFSNDRPAVTLFAIPVVLLLSAVHAVTRVHFRRVAERIARLELLFHSYVVALREQNVARPPAVRNLRRAIDAYQFGIERTFEKATWKQLRRANQGTLRWWLYVVMAGLLLGSAALLALEEEPADTYCLRTDNGGIARVKDIPKPVSGSVHVVPCPDDSSSGTTSTVP